MKLLTCWPYGASNANSVIEFGEPDEDCHDYIFFFDQEPVQPELHADTFDHVIAQCQQFYYTSNVTRSRPGFFVTSEHDSEFVELVCARYGWKPLYYFFHGWAALDWFRGYDKTFLMPEASKRQINTTFMSPNRIIGGARTHRIQMLYWIFKLNLGHNHISCPQVCPVEHSHILDLAQNLVKDYPDIVTVLANQTLPRNFRGETGHPMHSNCLSLFDEAADSLLYLVTESVATGRRHHLTEKSFKPIAMGMPFVIVGSQGSLAYLRSYGFRTFGELWDESYDQEPDTAVRIHRIGQLLQKLDQLSQTQKQDLWQQALPIIQHNLQHFYHGGFENTLWQELQQMLSTIQVRNGFEFVFDNFVDHKPFPNLVDPVEANQYESIGNEYPRICPLRLNQYIQQSRYPVQYHCGNDWRGFYPIGLAFFDFDIDYIALLPPQVKQAVLQGDLRLLFYYHEGDNPKLIKLRLDYLCDKHQLPSMSYRFVSGNTAADTMSGFVWFPDHESSYKHALVNNQVQPAQIHSRPRGKKFTILSRTHKWWRATVLAYMHRAKMLDQCYWSYDTIDLGDRLEHSPIMTWPFDLDQYVQQFVAEAPYRCDDLDSDQHNNHGILVKEHYENSYCNLVLETYFDADQSGGTFLTEKTFKPIAHGQPFVIFGPAHSLRTLRQMGYNTFDDLIDNSYDQETDNTKRFVRAMDAVTKLHDQDMHQWYQRCIPAVTHNQFVFMHSNTTRNRLVTLNARLT